VVPTFVQSATPRARLGLDQRGTLAAAARAAKEGLDKEHGIFDSLSQRSRRLSVNPFGTCGQTVGIPFLD
jgi:hypothetical protein